MKSILMITTLLFSLTATANDGGSAYLEVFGVNPEGIKSENIGWDKTAISIYGKEASEFAKTLPAPSTVSLGMMSDEDRAEFIANERSLSFFSKGWVFTISCSGGVLKMKDGENVDPRESLYYVVNEGPRGFRCNFSVAERGEMDPSDWLGDAFKFKPIDQEVNQCQKN